MEFGKLVMRVHSLAIVAFDGGIVRCGRGAGGLF